MTSSSVGLFGSDSLLKEFNSLRTTGKGFHGQNQGPTSGSKRGHTTANHYEPPSHHYEHIIEDQSIFGTPTYPSLNQCKRYVGGEDCSYGYFRRKSNPLYMKCSEFDQPQNHHFRCSCKYGFLAMTVCILIALAVATTCWIYESHLEAELKHLGDEMGLNKNSSLQNEEDIRFLKEQLKHLRDEMGLNKNSSLQNVEDIRFLKEQTLDFRQCQYRTKERGNSNVLESTLTDFVPDVNDAKNGVVTGVHCVVEGGTTAVLKFTGTQYACNCTGNATGNSRFCKIHYWYCPNIIQG